MPRLADHIVDCSIYLYRSERDAEAGTSGGGSGFLVHVPFQSSKSFIHPYAVTNKHLLDGGFHVLRLTKKSGGFETIRTNRQDWFPHPEGDDVEVYPIDIGDAQKWWSVSIDIFLTREIIHTYNVGIGDEVFLVGRLVSHEGMQKNAPIARFGNISLMADPTEPINSLLKNSFLLQL